MADIEAELKAIQDVSFSEAGESNEERPLLGEWDETPARPYRKADHAEKLQWTSPHPFLFRRTLRELRRQRGLMEMKHLRVHPCLDLHFKGGERKGRR